MNEMSMFLADDDLVRILAVSIGGGIAVIAIVVSAIKNMVIARGQERSRREVAAYIAEGSMTPEEGERLLKAGMKKWERC